MPLAILPVVLAALAIAGCGASASVSIGGGFDSSDAEQKIAQGFERSNPKAPKVKSVDCPEDIDASKGTKADCKLTLVDGSKGTVHITMTDDNGGFDYSLNGVH